MRYELKSGYIHKVFFGCQSGSCKLYSGTIPSGYTSLEEWAEKANIRAYKIVSGNLTYDSAKDATLQKEYEELAKTYSTTEKKIGTWTDGKPIYRKVIELTSPSTSDEMKLTTLSNVSTMIDIRGNITNSANAQVKFPYIFNVNNFGGLWYNTADKGIYCVVINGAYQGKKITAIIEYTKTTD